MLTTCGSSSRWVRRSTPPNRVTRASSHRGPVRDSSSARHARIVRNFSISKVVPFRPGARLAVEQRTTVGDEVADDHDRRHRDERRPRRTAPSADVEQPLHPRVPGRVHLTDVEQQRHPLELGDRQLAEPLLVEQRQRADANAVPRGAVDACTTMSSFACAARLSTTTVAPAIAGRVEQRTRRRDAGRRRFDGREPAHDERRALGARAELRLQGLELVGGRDDEHAVALAGTRVGVVRDRRAQHVPGHQDDRAAEARRTAAAARRRRRAGRTEMTAAAETVAEDRREQRARAGCAAARAGRTRRR